MSRRRTSSSSSGGGCRGRGSLLCACTGVSRGCGCCACCGRGGGSCAGAVAAAAGVCVCVCVGCIHLLDIRERHGDRCDFDGKAVGIVQSDIGEHRGISLFIQQGSGQGKGSSGYGQMDCLHSEAINHRDNQEQDQEGDGKEKRGEQKMDLPFRQTIMQGFLKVCDGRLNLMNEDQGRRGRWWGVCERGRNKVRGLFLCCFHIRNKDLWNGRS